MFAIYASTLLICLASLAIGRAILGLLGAPRPPWLSAASGFAALVIVSPFLLRLPGRATTAVVIVALAAAAAAVIAVGDLRRSGREAATGPWLVGLAVGAIVLAAASLPFLINGHVGVLGQGIYTNDHAAQLYWGDWLQHGFGPEPSAVRFGYPIGPQAVAVIAAQATGTSLVSSFNGLLLAIGVLTGLTALGALAALPLGRRIAVASVCGLPYLAASFLAQSSFKEIAMALFVLAFALALATQSGPQRAEGRPPWRSVVAICLLMAAASVFTFSIPGLAWFVLVVPLWLALEALAGRSPVDWGSVRDGLAAHKVTLAVAAVILVGIAAVAFSPAREFVSKIADVQNSTGRLSSPVFPGEVLGIWPQGDFRIVRGDVSGALFAVALGALAVGFGALALWRRRQFALLAMLVTGGAVYLGTRAFAEIHVQAKALTVVSPLVLLVALRGLLDPPATPVASGEWRVPARYAFGYLVLLTAAISTLLALRAAPIGFDQRELGLEQLAQRADGHTLAFLGVDRFAGYSLRDTLARSPAGYVPQEIGSRLEKTWQQGLAVDFDTLAPGQLDKFDYAITPTAAYASTPPANFEQVASAGDYELWKRSGPTPRSRVLTSERGDAGAQLDCTSTEGRKLLERGGTAQVLTPAPVLVGYTQWNTPAPAEPAAGGQELGFEAPGTATTEFHSPGGQLQLSLQYQSQVPLGVYYRGRKIAELPASLDGMYLSAAGRGAFWPAGEISDPSPGPREIEIRAESPTGIADTLGAPRRVWLGDLAVTSEGAAKTVPLDRRACGLYVDHFELDKRGG